MNLMQQSLTDTQKLQHVAKNKLVGVIDDFSIKSSGFLLKIAENDE